ncbi:MAG: DsrE family protein [Bdellovibrionota bacterium]
MRIISWPRNAKDSYVNGVELNLTRAKLFRQRITRWDNMASIYLSSRETYPESVNTQRVFELIENLCNEGNDVALFLVQNGVFTCRKKSAQTTFNQLLGKENIKIYADDYSLEERGILPEMIHDAIKPTPISTLAALTMEENRTPIWH